MRRALGIFLALSLALSLVACSNQDKPEDEGNPYILANGMTPTEFQDAVEDFVYDIYSPKNQDILDRGLKNFKEISTATEYLEMESSIGEFDADKMATVSNIEVDLCMPDNSSSRTYKLIVTFTVNLGEYKQGTMLEFTCNNEGLIDSHSVWLNNDV